MDQNTRRLGACICCESGRREICVDGGGAEVRVDDSLRVVTDVLRRWKMHRKC